MTRTSRLITAIAEGTGMPESDARKVVTVGGILDRVAARHEARCDGCETCAKWRTTKRRQQGRRK